MKKILALLLAFVLLVSAVVVSTVTAATEGFTHDWENTDKFWFTGGLVSSGATATPDANGIRLFYDGTMNGWKDAQAGINHGGVAGSFANADGIKFNAYLGANNNFASSVQVNISVGSTTYKKTVNLSKSDTEYMVAFDGAATDDGVAISESQYGDISGIAFYFGKWVGSETAVVMDVYISDLTSYSSSEVTITDGFTFKWNSEGYWKGGNLGSAAEATHDENGVNLSYNGTFNGWKDVTLGAYSGIPGSFNGMTGIKFKAYVGSDHTLDKTMSVKFDTGSGTYITSVVLTASEAEYFVPFKGAKNGDVEITEDLYGSIGVVQFSMSKWVGSDTALVCNTYIGNFTAYKMEEEEEVTAYTYELEKCSPASSAGGGGEYSDSGITYYNTGITAVDQYIDFTLKSVPAGTYNIDVYSRDYNNRGLYQFSANGANIGSPVDFAVAEAVATYNKHTIGTVTVSEAGDVVVRFTCVGTNSAGYGLYVDKLVLTATEESGEELPTQAPTTEAPTQAPTDAPTQAPTDAPTQAPTDAPVSGGLMIEDFNDDATVPAGFETINGASATISDAYAASGNALKLSQSNASTFPSVKIKNLTPPANAIGFKFWAIRSSYVAAELKFRSSTDASGSNLFAQNIYEIPYTSSGNGGYITVDIPAEYRSSVKSIMFTLKDNGTNAIDFYI
ncbi:MAG: PT domain-containing protein, partial [Clostridia bacterium]|nr:PT domain-containing protein [Clostridia bacterium]